jgi:DNA repair exonuclease SbcCD ATPase subunit
MRKLIIFTFVALAMVACKQNNNNADEHLTQQLDSLRQVIAQKDNEINDVVGTFNDIEQGFREISEAQGRVTVAQSGEGSGSADRIRENMQFIQSTMQQNRELINKLRQQLRESTINGEQLKRTIDNLTRQLEEKDAQLRSLREELLAKEIHIVELDETIAGLSEDVSSLREESSAKSETINSQDQKLNQAWFVFGTKKELKEQKILVDGKVLQDNFNKSYFTKIDIRVDKEIKLYSRDAEILTSHPAGSYSLTRDANKQYVLRITRPETFWSTSKYLVVLVK